MWFHQYASVLRSYTLVKCLKIKAISKTIALRIAPCRHIHKDGFVLLNLFDKCFCFCRFIAGDECIYFFFRQSQHAVAWAASLHTLLFGYAERLGENTIKKVGGRNHVIWTAERCWMEEYIPEIFFYVAFCQIAFGDAKFDGFHRNPMPEVDNLSTTSKAESNIWRIGVYEPIFATKSIP